MSNELQHLCQRFGSHQPGLMNARNAFAVLCPLVEKNDGLHLLFEVRSGSVSQAGEVCFPGGHMESEETPEETALRETEEELSIPRSCISIIGKPDFLGSQANFLLHPVLALVSADGLAAMSPAPAEVAEVFTAPLTFFKENPPQEYYYDLIPQVHEDFPYEAIGISREYPWRRGRQEVPVWFYQGHAVWGMTARIVKHLISD